MALHLKIITPKRKVLEQEIVSLSVPTVSGEITILTSHVPLLSLLREGILTIKTATEHEYMSIGGGYLETDGKNITVLVSRAYKQSEIDEEQTRKAIENAQSILAKTQDTQERTEAAAMLKRSMVDLSVLRKLRRKNVV